MATHGSTRNPRMATEATRQAATTRQETDPRAAAVTPGTVAIEPELVRAGRRSAGLWRDAWHQLVHDRAAAGGMVVIALLILIAVVAPVVTPYPPNDQSFRIKLEAPDSNHWLGTDEFGRDVFSRVLVGTRVALFVGIVPVVIAMILG